jgi:hypothetical protein
MEINEIMTDIHRNAVAKGFWENDNIGEKLMLVVSELSESLEAHRSNKHADLDEYYRRASEIINSYKDPNNDLTEEDFIMLFKHRIKDTFEDEIADTVIRLFDLCKRLDIDIETHIKLKHAYNKTRPYKHNKLY